MWGSTFSVDSRRNCFITVPQKWGIDLGKMSVIKIQQSNCPNTYPVYATVIGDTGPSDVDSVVMSAQFARANHISAGKEGTFQLVKEPIPALSTVVAIPTSGEDWELLEMNAEQIQYELMNRIRVVWKGARIPVWISDFISLTIEIDELDPDCNLGILMENTEIHVSPPVKMPTIAPSVDDHPTTTISSMLRQLATHFLPIPTIKPVKEFRTSVILRVHSVSCKGNFRKFLEKHGDIIPQPYQAFVSKEHNSLSDPSLQYCVGCIRKDDRVCYFTVIFVGDNENWRPNRNAIYVSDNIVQQLKLNIKQRVTVQLDDNFHRNRVDSLTFFTFLNDYGMKSLEKESKLWLQSAVGSELALTLNRGQHLDVPSLVKGKKHRLFVSITPEAEYCCIDQLTLRQIEDKLKFVRISAKNPPSLLRIPDDSVPAEPTIESVRLGGMGDFIRQCSDFLTTALGLQEESSVFTGCRHGNLLLTGPRGSGRTSIARHICSQLEGDPDYVHSVYVDCAALKGKKIETLQREWRSVFHELLDKQPAVMILDDLDLLACCPQNEHDDSLGGENWYSTRITELLWEIVNSTPFLNQVVVIATAANSKALHPKLNHYQSKHMFTSEMTIPALNLPMRIDVLRVIFEKIGIAYDTDVDVLARAAKQMDGYTATDMQNVVEKAAHLAISESGRTADVHVKGKHIESAVEDHVPFGLYGINFKPPVESRKCWDDVGGLAEAKQMLLETLKWPTQYPELFSHCPIRLRSALLLYGAPGTGKTLLASAVASECGVNFISIKGPELLSKFIGASEEAVRETFRRARSAKPCILFFDEFDSLAPRRGHDSTGVTDRVVNQLLTELDGVEGQEVGLWVLAATSRPDLIDPALLRPGRFDVAVNCPLPNKDERLGILKALSSRLHLVDSIRLESIAEETANFSGADLQAVLYTAQLKALNEQKQAMDRQAGPIRITQEHLVAALRETRPSVSASERQQYDRIYQKFQSGRSRNADHSTEQMEHSRVTLA